MKQKFTNTNKSVELVEKEKSCDHAESNSYPFMPMMDLTIVFDELKRMVKTWFLNKKERKNHLQKETDETI